FTEEVLRALGGKEEYESAAAVVAPVVLAGFFQAAATLLGAAFFVRRRTGLKLGGALAATPVILGVYGALIPAWGATGAALATLGGFAFMAVAGHMVTQRIFYVRYEWGRLAGLLALTAGLWLAGAGLPAGGWAAAAKSALLVSAPAAAWLAGPRRGAGEGLAPPPPRPPARPPGKATAPN